MAVPTTSENQSSVTGAPLALTIGVPSAARFGSSSRTMNEQSHSSSGLIWNWKNSACQRALFGGLRDVARWLFSRSAKQRVVLVVGHVARELHGHAAVYEARRVFGLTEACSALISPCAECGCAWRERNEKARAVGDVRGLMRVVDCCPPEIELVGLATRDRLVLCGVARAVVASCGWLVGSAGAHRWSSLLSNTTLPAANSLTAPACAGAVCVGCERPAPSPPSIAADSAASRSGLRRRPTAG